MAVYTISVRAGRCFTLWALRGRSGRALRVSKPTGLQDAESNVGLGEFAEGGNTCRGGGCSACASTGVRGRRRRPVRTHLQVAHLQVRPAWAANCICAGRNLHPRDVITGGGSVRTKVAPRRMGSGGVRLRACIDMIA